MSPKVFVRLPLITFGILSVAVVAGQPTSVTAEEYPWCSQGSILRCYYMTREQCEEAVGYHGFGVANSSAPTTNNEALLPREMRSGHQRDASQRKWNHLGRILTAIQFHH
jgi:hypothetical protein